MSAKPWRAGCRVLGALALASLGGCLFHTGDFTIASTQKLPVQFRELGIAEGRDCTQILFGLPLGPIVPSLGKAVSRALARSPGADALINLSVYRDDRYFVFFQQTCMRVKGMAASTRPQPEAAEAAPAGP